MFKTTIFTALAGVALLSGAVADARPRERLTCQDANDYSVCLGGAPMDAARAKKQRDREERGRMTAEEYSFFARPTGGGSTATGGGAGGGGGGGGR